MRSLKSRTRLAFWAVVSLSLLYRLACGIIARSAGLFQNPKQICACDGVTLWEERDRPIAGKGRSKASTETPAAHLWTSVTNLCRAEGTERAPCREMRRTFVDGGSELRRGRRSTEEHVSRQLDRRPKKNGLIFFKFLSVLKSNSLVSVLWGL